MSFSTRRRGARTRWVISTLILSFAAIVVIAIQSGLLPRDWIRGSQQLLLSIRTTQPSAPQEQASRTSTAAKSKPRPAASADDADLGDVDPESELSPRRDADEVPTEDVTEVEPPRQPIRGRSGSSARRVIPVEPGMDEATVTPETPTSEIEEELAFADAPPEPVAETDSSSGGNSPPIRTIAAEDLLTEPTAVPPEKVAARPSATTPSAGRKLPDANAGTRRSAEFVHDAAAGTANPGSEAAAGTAAPLTDLAIIDGLIAQGEDLTALDELTRWYWKTPTRREELRPKLEEVSNRIYFNSTPHYFEPYVIQPGDQLRTIAKKYKLSWEYLSRLNRVEPQKIRPGQKLKVVPGPFDALVVLRSHELIVTNGGRFVKRYRIGAGKDRSTPIGLFTVKNKMVDPTYYGPDGVIKSSDPRNPLGERWIDIGDSFGIHGTIDPQSIGKDESRGCVRLLNADVEEVYDLLTLGSEVKIQK